MYSSSSSSLLYRRAWATTLFLFALYWLTASGAFHSIDEHAVFAVSRNLLLHGEWNQSTLFWGVPYIDQARIGLDGELYAKYGIGHSLLITGVMAATSWIPGATLASSAMILNGLATALTGGLLVLMVGRLGYENHQSGWVGVTLGLLFGMTTFAWVYAKTMFSEPLVGLGWLTVVCLLWDKQQVGWKRLILAGTVLGLSVMIRPASVLLVPFFVLPLWQRPFALVETRTQIKRLLIFGTPLVLMILLLLWFNWFRFADPLQFGYSERFDGDLWAGLTGFLFSLDRSLFLFAPPLLLLFYSIPRFLRQHRVWGITLLTISLISILIYSVWPVFWGGPVWGPRYLLPVLPLLMLLLAPAVEQAWQKGRTTALLLLLAGLGLLIQLPGVLWNSLPQTQELGQRYPLWLLWPRAEWLDVVWLATYWQGLIVSAFLMGLALIALRWPHPYLLATATVASLVGSVVLLMWLGQSGFDYAQSPVYHEVMMHLQEDAQAGDALLLNPAPYQAPIEQLIGWMNQPTSMPLYGLYRYPPTESGLTEQQINKLLDKHERLWLLTEEVAQGDPNSTTEHLLVKHASIIKTQWLADDYRLTLFATPKTFATKDNPPLLFEQHIRLTEWHTAWSSPTDSSLQLQLTWQTEDLIDRSLHTFAQLLNEQGQLVAGWDSIPQAGFAPTSTWQANEPVTERLTLLVPPDTPSGTLRLIIGLYDPSTGERLLTTDGADAETLTELVWP